MTRHLTRWLGLHWILGIWVGGAERPGHRGSPIDVVSIYVAQRALSPGGGMSRIVCSGHSNAMGLLSKSSRVILSVKKIRGWQIRTRTPAWGLTP